MARRDVLTTDFARRHPEAFGRILRRGEPPEILEVLAGLPRESVAAVVATLPAPLIDTLLGAGEDAAVRWLGDAPLADSIRLLGRISHERGLALANAVRSRERKRRLLQYLQYPPHCVGALVDDIRTRLPAATPAVEVLGELREKAVSPREPIVVVGRDGHYAGLLDPWALLSAGTPDGLVSDYLVEAPPLRPETPLASAIKNPSWHEHNWLPVVDAAPPPLGGVSRGALFAAAERRAVTATRRGGLLMLLLDEFVRAMGGLLERAFRRPGRSG